MKRRNPTIILVIDLHFRGDQRLTSNDRWFVTYGSDTNISLQKESVHPGPFGNSKFLNFVYEYYKECSAILDVNPDFHFVPEHERPHGVKVFWLKARFNDSWQPTLQGEGPHTEKQRMDFIKKVYSICCYTNASKAKQITDLILWRIERILKECRRQVDMGPDGPVELYDALTCITHARNFIGNKPGLLLMAMFPSYGKSRFEIAFVFPSVDGSYNERRARGEIVPRNRWIDKLTARSAQNALRPDGKEFYVDPEMEFYVRCNSGHTRDPILWTTPEQQKGPQHDEPDYDHPTKSIPPSSHPSRSEAPREDESTAQPKHRMRRPAPPSIEEERKIKPFAKKPITFMFHATYGNQLFSIMEHGLKSGKSQSNPSGRMHVHMACIDDVILDDDESEAALTHVPAGRDALLILALLKDQDYGIRLSEERTALTDKTIEARNIVAAFEPDGSLMASNKWIMKKHLSYEDYEMYDTKIREFADAFFNYVNSTKHSKEKYTSSETKKRRHSTDQDEAEEETMEPSGKDPSSQRSAWNIIIQRT